MAPQEHSDGVVSHDGQPVEGMNGGSSDSLASSKRSKCGTGAAQPKDGSTERNKALENLDECMKGLMISQMRESSIQVEEGLMTLLRRRLAAAASPKGGRFVLVRGNVDHYASRDGVDMGWGCGWRNLQMMISYLMSEDLDLREELFGGAGFVPDIPALQHWLEIAWAKGFDVPGGEYFDWKIKGSNKWIGTTEGAALLRSFGARARIVDFQATGGKRSSRNELRSKTGGEEVHDDDGTQEDGQEDGHSQEDGDSPSSEDESGKSIEPRRTATDNGTLDQACIICGEHKQEQEPETFRHEGEDSDMCPHCLKQLQDSGNTDKQKFINEEETQITGRHRAGWDDKTGGGSGESGAITVKHQQLVEWVWRYFMSEVEDSEGPLVCLSRRSPLYFQHRGHSQTVIGVERRKVSTSPDAEEVNLLLLDPDEQTNNIVKSLKSGRGWESLVKRGLQTLKQTEYQLCYCERGVAKGQEFENLKTLTSKSYTY